MKTALTSAKGLTESSAIACVKLCKCATYVKPEDNSVLCFLVLTVMNELKVGVGGFWGREGEEKGGRGKRKG